MKLDVSRRFPSTETDEDLPFDLGRPVTGSPFVSVPYLARALRRRRSLVAATAVAGLAVAAIASLASPPPHTATATLFVVHGSRDVPNRDMNTDLGLLKTTTVAEKARQKLNERTRVARLRDSYDGIPISDRLMWIRARGKSPAAAVRRADAVASAFLEFRAEEFTRQAQLAVRSIEERQRLLAAELADINNRIAASAGDQRSDTAIRAYGDLLTRRGTLSDQISGLRQQVELQTRDAAAITEQSRVVDPASSDLRPTTATLLGNLAAGLVGGVALGAAYVILHALASDRLRRRDDIAAALGAPVGVSIRPLRGRLPKLRRLLQAHVEQPDPDVSRLERHLLRSLSVTGSVKPALLVLSLDSDGPAAVGVAAAASALSRSGIPTLVVDLTAQSSLAPVLAVPTDRPTTLRPDPGGAPVTVAFAPEQRASEDVGLEALRTAAEAVLLLGRLDPGLGAVPLVEWATSAVAVVTCGRSTETALRSAAHMLRVAGLGFQSAIVVGPDPDDESAGLVGADHGEPAAAASPAWAGR